MLACARATRNERTDILALYGKGEVVQVIVLLLEPCDPTLLDWYCRHADALWLAGGCYSESDVSRLRERKPVTVFDHPIDSRDGAAIERALATIQEHHPLETINIEGDGTAWIGELRGRLLVSLKYDEETFQWVFDFGDRYVLRVICAWRLCANGRIRLGHQDDGQLFGLKQPLDAKHRLLEALEGRCIVEVRLSEDSGDLVLDFGANSRLEFFNDSCGYEGWDFFLPGRRWVVAQGGGKLSLGRFAQAEPEAS